MVINLLSLSLAAPLTPALSQREREFFSSLLGVCRENPISPCKLSELRVSVLKLLRKTIHHGDTEHTERDFPTGS